MNKYKLAKILKQHQQWHLGNSGKRADLREADLRGADLSNADLSGADLRGADLSGADLSGADLSGADLRDANLRRTDLRRADLSDTILDSENIKRQRTFCRQCPPLKTGGRFVYRTAKSQHIGSTQYKPGHTYVAPFVSADIVTACHPGIYAGSLHWMRTKYQDTPLVRCYVRDGDWFITAKGAIRCKRLRVLNYVE